MKLSAADVADVRRAVRALDLIEARHPDDWHRAPFDAIANARQALLHALREAES